MAARKTAVALPGSGSPLFLSHHLMGSLLLLAALAVIVVLFSFMVLEFNSLSRTYLPASMQAEIPAAIPDVPPRLDSKLVGSSATIAEVDKSGNTVRVIYSSSLTDDIADFSLFAVPQEHYEGLIYVRAIVDGDTPLLKVYPLEVANGKIKASTLNTTADNFLLSSDQELLGVLDGKTATLYDIATGEALASQTFANALTAEATTLTFDDDDCLSISIAASIDLTEHYQLCPNLLPQTR